jgi:hypothetical protein
MMRGEVRDATFIMRRRKKRNFAVLKVSRQYLVVLIEKVGSTQCTDLNIQKENILRTGQFKYLAEERR